MNDSIRNQALAHLSEREEERQAHEDAAKAAAEAKRKADAADQAEFLERCQREVKPAMLEFGTYIDGRIISGVCEDKLAIRPDPSILFEFQATTKRRLASVLYRRAAKLGTAEFVTVISNVAPETTQVQLQNLTNEFVQLHLLKVLKQLKG